MCLQAHFTCPHHTLKCSLGPAEAVAVWESKVVLKQLCSTWSPCPYLCSHFTCHVDT